LILEKNLLEISCLKEIEAAGIRNGVFSVIDRSGRKYVLKYRGNNSEKITAISEITNSFPETFPRGKLTLDRNTFFQLSDGFYGVEDFITAEKNPRRDLVYFLELGKSIALMHQQLSIFFEENTDLKNLFLSKAKHLSDSNLLSLGFDLDLKGVREIDKELRLLMSLGISEKISALPEHFIHGDLNYSNVIWTHKGPKFIDVESIKSSKRILELEAPLIFEGNMEPPIYISNSFNELVKGYNQFTPDPFTNQELVLGLVLVKYALIKNFVVRNIRRGEERNSLDNLLRNLSNLEGVEKN